MKLFSKILSCKEFDIAVTIMSLVNTIGFFICATNDNKFKDLK